MFPNPRVATPSEMSYSVIKLDCRSFIYYEIVIFNASEKLISLRLIETHSRRKGCVKNGSCQRTAKHVLATVTRSHSLFLRRTKTVSLGPRDQALASTPGLNVQRIPTFQQQNPPVIQFASFAWFYTKAEQENILKLINALGTEGISLEAAMRSFLFYFSCIER